MVSRRNFIKAGAALSLGSFLVLQLWLSN
ncbi:twin-arginine translocation signal domain-containing protein [Pseudoalteromonas sp. B193]